MPAYPKSKQTRKTSGSEAKPKLKIKPADLLRALLYHYDRPDHLAPSVMAVEVGLANGGRVDAIILMHSRDPIAVEVKVSRADWLNELKRPEKHKEALDLAGCLYFLAPAGVIKPKELPPGTGLFEADPFTQKCKRIVQADRKEPSRITWHTAFHLALGVLRAAGQGIV